MAVEVSGPAAVGLTALLPLQEELRRDVHVSTSSDYCGASYPLCGYDTVQFHSSTSRRGRSTEVQRVDGLEHNGLDPVEMVLEQLACQE